MGAEADENHQTKAIKPAEAAALPYATPQALLAAITDKVSYEVASGSVYNHDELRRHLAYDRFLARVFTSEPDRWLLKGGVALLARIPDARHSKDLDIAFAGNLDQAADAVSAAAAIDLGDFFISTIGAVKAVLTGPTPGVRLPVDTRIGPKPFGSFHIDVVLENGMTTAPDSVEPLSPIRIEGLVRVQYRTYPLVDHLADKHAAMIETHNGRSSTRYRDLVDIVEIAATHHLDAKPLSVALFTKYALRALSAPSHFKSPGADWPEGYAAVAKTVPALAQQTFEEASIVAAALLDPLLSGRKRGRWDPATLTWLD